MRKIADGRIIEVCTSSNSMKEAKEILGVSLNWLEREARKLGCWRPNKGGKNTIKFPGGRINKIFTLEKWNKDELIYVSRSSMLSNIKNLELLEYECSVCKVKEWEGKVLTLDLDHINGISDDHRRSNLRFLCPNCHSQTKTFKNKRGSKKSRKKKTTNEEVIEAIKNNPNEGVSGIARILDINAGTSFYERVRKICKENSLNFPSKVMIN